MIKLDIHPYDIFDKACFSKENTYVDTIFYYDRYFSIILGKIYVVKNCRFDNILITAKLKLTVIDVIEDDSHYFYNRRMYNDVDDVWEIHIYEVVVVDSDFDHSGLSPTYHEDIISANEYYVDDMKTLVRLKLLT